MSRTQELLTKIRTICVEIRDIKRTSQKQYIKTPFKGQDRDNPRTTDRSYSSPPHKEEEQDGKPDYFHTASTSPSLASPPTDSSDIQRRYAGEEASSPATYPSTLPSPLLPHAAPPDSLSPSGDAFEPADEDPRGYTTGPCSAGIQMDCQEHGFYAGFFTFILELIFPFIVEFTNIHFSLCHLGARNRSGVSRKHIYWRRPNKKTRVILVVVQSHKKKLLSLW